MVESGLRSLVLWCLRHMEEGLHYVGAVFHLLAFELFDLVSGAAPLRLARQAFDPLDEDAAVPAAVEDGDLAGARQFLPEAPEEMAGLLLFGRRADRPDAVAARVPFGGEALDRPALPRCVPAPDGADGPPLGHDLAAEEDRKRVGEGD